IVLITSEPAWRFQALAPIAPDQRAAIRASLQFGDASLEVLPLASRLGGADQDVVRLRLPGGPQDGMFVEH
ncbi:hypothetical protein, partial [Serratia marcescens]|uniref:hypothetical protein n=1 Tax=Serratia marcescens TaxID=615 RepID=UPI001952F15D